MPARTPETPGPALPEAQLEELYAVHLRQREEGRGVSLEDLCARHPDQAEGLRAMDRAVRRVEAADRALGLFPRGSVGTLPPQDRGAEGADALGLAEEVLDSLAAESPVRWPFDKLERIGSGGFGTVWRAEQGTLRRSVALKAPRDWAADGAGSREQLLRQRRSMVRFVVEAQVLAQLDHPSIVPLYGAGVDPKGKPYLTMRLVRGRDFTEILGAIHAGTEEWTLARGLEVLLKVCDAIAYAHSRGVLHRDLKPDNVRVGRFGEVYVMDWGLARLMDEGDAGEDAAGVVHAFRDLQEGPDAEHAAQPASGSGSWTPTLTVEGTAVGSPCTMAPEQARGDLERLGAPADVYSLGALLYHLLAGQAPYVRPGVPRTAAEIIEEVKDGPPAPLSELADGLSPELVAICEKAMQRDPEQRYPSVDDLAGDLRAFLDGRVVLAYGSGRFLELRKWTERNRGLARTVLGAAAFLLVGLTLFSILLTAKNREIAGSKERFEARDALTDELLFQSRLFSFETGSGWPLDKGAHMEIADAHENVVVDGRAAATDPEYAVRLHNSIGFARMGQGRFVSARAQFQAGLDLLESLDEDQAAAVDLAALAPVLRLGLLYVDAFDREISAGRERFAQLEGAFPELSIDEVDRLMAASILEHSAGRLGRSLDLALRGQEILETIRDLRSERTGGAPLREVRTGAIEAQIANVRTRFFLRDKDEAVLREVHAETRRLVGERGGFEQGLAGIMLARQYLLLKQPDAALEAAEAAVERIEDFSGEDSAHTLHLGAVRADALLSAGRVEEGLEHYRQAIEACLSQDELRRTGVSLRLRSRFAQALAREQRPLEALREFELWEEGLREKRPELGLEHFRVYTAWSRLLLAEGSKSAEGAAPALPSALSPGLEAQVRGLIEAAERIAAQLARHEREEPEWAYAWHPGELTALRVQLAQAVGDTSAAEAGLEELRAQLRARPVSWLAQLWATRFGADLPDADRPSADRPSADRPSADRPSAEAPTSGAGG